VPDKELALMLRLTDVFREGDLVTSGPCLEGGVLGPIEPSEALFGCRKEQSELYEPRKNICV